MISASQMREAQSVPLEYAPAPSPEDPDFEPFMERVRREVEGRLGPEALGRGGLRIYTTLKPELQRAAVETSGEVLYEPDDPSAAVVSVEPQSGAIRALAGQAEGFNLPLDARRQPGAPSSRSCSPRLSRRTSRPRASTSPHELNFRFLNEYYVINNYDFVERGEISVREAMAESDNTVFVQLAADVGLERVVRTARASGHHEPDRAVSLDGHRGLGNRRQPARDGFGLRDVRRGRHPPRAVRRRTGGEGELRREREPL